MGTLLKTLFISVTLFMLVATSHEPNKIFQDLVTHFADNSKATPAAAWKEFYKSIHGNDPNRPV